MLSKESQKHDPFQRSPVRPLFFDWITSLEDKIIVDLLLKSEQYQESQSYREQCHAILNFLSVLG